MYNVSKEFLSIIWPSIPEVQKISIVFLFKKKRLKYNNIKLKNIGIK